MRFDRRIFLAIPTLLALVFVVILFGCTRPALLENPIGLSVNAPLEEPTATPAATLPAFMPPTREPGAPILSPTPDPPRQMPTQRSEAEQYIVQWGDSLGKIAQRFNVTWQLIASANEILDPNLLEVGQTLTIPVAEPQPPGSDFKIIPDSELVNGPVSAVFDIQAFIERTNGYLAHYTEEVDEQNLTGAQIVQRVVNEYSLSPRLLLSVLDYQSGWVTRSNPDESTRTYPMGMVSAYREGLYHQLAWAANQLNHGYYGWRASGFSNWILADGSLVPISPTINAGTAGVQYFFANLYGRAQWDHAVSSAGLFAMYQGFFGYPFDLAIEPLIPSGLTQPTFQLPFEPGTVWSFTGGPHGGWADGSGWAAIDFAPPGEPMGCVTSDAWVVALADGEIVRTGNGAVIQDLDGDGLEQTGWTIFYMHMDTYERVQTGQFVRAGEHIGHPSCEGGVSNGTHLHLARKYNGEWIPADGPLPFNLDGWISSGTGTEYDGYLTRNEQTLEAWDGRAPENQIQR